MENFHEKRKALRVEGFFEVFVNFNPETPDKFYCNTRDVSEGGMRIRTKKPLKDGSHAILTFSLPNHPLEIVVQAIVAWASTIPKDDNYYESGIKFLVINDAEREAIHDYIVQHADRIV
ncbi:MAG: PilZ domain-containing protein [Candidatus Omnitrophica bacterium]|nr:PilZ domain-containing protein [Candidatus Omnitrophota bacterium]